jgi:phage portal protein BeeE
VAKMPILTRLAEAASMVMKGSWLGANFNRIPIIDGDSNERLSEPYKNSAWVHRAIKKIAGPISACQLRFRANRQEIKKEPWVSFWRNPVENLNYSDFVEAAVGWLKLSGEFFNILPPGFDVPFPETRAQWPKLVMARPSRMLPIKDDEQLAGWEFQTQAGATQLPLARVVQTKYWNPYDPIRGLSEYESAQVASEADYLSGKFALNVARNNGDQGVIIAAKGGTPTDAQIQQITGQLREKRRRQQRGEFVPVFLSGDVEIHDPKIASVDADFVAQRLQNRFEIYAAFGVPMSMATLTNSTSVGSSSDRYALIEDACIPTAAKISEHISFVASIQAGYQVEAYFDWSEHPVMRQVRREGIDNAVKLFDHGVPMKVASDYLGLDLPRFPGDNLSYLPMAVVPIEPTDPEAKARRG